MRWQTVVRLRGLPCLVLVVLLGCGGNSSGDEAKSSLPQPSPTAEARSTEEPPADPCASYPPPFEASYLPEGFKDKLRKGAGLFKGTDYPTEGLVGHYRGKTDGIHANFEVQGGPLPYEPANPKPLKVLSGPGRIGVIEGGFAVEFSLDECDFRMDTYGVSRADTIDIAKGLEEKQ